MIFLMLFICFEVSPQFFVSGTRDTYSTVSQNRDKITVSMAYSSSNKQRLVCPDHDRTLIIEQAWFGLDSVSKIQDCRTVPLDVSDNWQDLTNQVNDGCNGTSCYLPFFKNKLGNKKTYWLICFKCIKENEQPPKQIGIKMESTEKTSTSKTLAEPTKRPELVTEVNSEGGLVIFDDIINGFDIQRLSEEDKGEAKKFALKLLQKIFTEKVAEISNSSTSGIKSAEAILQITDLLVGRLTLLLKEGESVSLTIEALGNSTITLIHQHINEDMQINIDGISLGHQNAISDGNSIRAAVVIYQDINLANSFGLLDECSEIKSVSVFSRAGKKKSNVQLELGKEVHLTFEPKYLNEESTHRCVFWDFLESDWSSVGCETRIQNSSLLCKCNHLTNFAVLVSLKHTTQILGNSWRGIHLEILRLITLVGCSLSAMALLASLIFFVQQDSSNDRVKINAHFCFNLFLAELLILGGLNNDLATGVPSLCIAVAVFLHFSLLAAFFWSLIAGFQIYLLLVVIFNSDVSRMTRYKLVGYGFPLFMVAISLSIDAGFFERSTYTSKSLLPCWMEPNTVFVTLFIVPISIIIVINMCTLLLALFRVCHLSPRPFLYQQARGLLSLLFILGGTWMIGIMNNLYPSLVLVYLFTILNSLQGVFIFIFYVVLGEKFRETTQAICREKRVGREMKAKCLQRGLSYDPSSL